MVNVETDALVGPLLAALYVAFALVRRVLLPSTSFRRRALAVDTNVARPPRKPGHGDRG